MPRVAVLGQKDALVRALYELARLRREHPLEIIVLTPTVQGLALHGSDVRGACGAFGFRHIIGDTDKTVLEELQPFKPDLIVSILWPRRIQNEVLALCPDCINFHPSLLPRHRGSLTQFWAVFDGDHEAGATCHRMVWEFDAGRILEQVAVPVAPDETALSLSVKIAAAVEECFRTVMRLFLQPAGLPEGQGWEVGAFPYHYRRIPKGGVIDPGWPDEKVERFIRAMYFPPHAPAKAVGPGGSEHTVVTMEEYRAVRAGQVGSCSQAAPHPSNSAADRGSQSRPWWPFPRRAALCAVVLPVLLAVAQWPLAPLLHRWRNSLLGFGEGSDSSSQPEPTLQPDANVAVRFRVDERTRARCLDGSPVTYYLAPSASPSGRSKWLFYLQGGGWCTESPSLANQTGYSHDEAVGHPDLCSSRAKGYHGSSKADHSFRNLGGKGFLSGEPSVNPLMHNWNRVIFRNCDGTLFLSSLDAPLDASGTHLYFRGRDNVFATVDTLLARHGLDLASEVVISGCSAGGVAAVLLADQLRAYLEARVRNRVFVVALSDSSVFPEQPREVPPSVLSFPQFEWLFDRTNASAGAPARCLEHGLAWRCLQVHVALPHVATPVFLLQSLADSWHVSDALEEGALTTLAGTIRMAVLPSLRAPHAGALDSCFHHCEQWGGIRWGGQTNAAAFQQWYRARWRQWAQDPAQTGRAESAAAAEGWPLLHVAEPWVEGCYESQREHLRWHQQLRRVT